MAGLKLGMIEDDKPVRLTIELTAAVHRMLLAYARVHAEQTGLPAPVPVERLVGPMLERFMTSDRGFVRSKN